MIAPFTLGRTPPPAEWEPTEGPGSGDDRYRFKPGTERLSLLNRVFPLDQCDFTIADAHNYGRSPLAYGEWSAPVGEVAS